MDILTACLALDKLIELQAKVERLHPTSQDTERLKYLYSYNTKKELIVEHSYEQWIANIDILKELSSKQKD